MAEFVQLNAGRLRLAVYPEGGGAIVRFERRTPSGAWVDIMRPAGAEAIARREPIGMSCFPLVPYCDLVTGGGFTFDGVHYSLPRNHPNIADPIHGEGWISPWRVEASTERTLSLGLRHDAGEPGFPFSYSASLAFTLDGDRLEIVVGIVNRDRWPMPGGIGIHPYYVRTADVVVKAGVPRVWPAEAVKNRAAAIPVPPEWDFRALRPFGAVDLDHSFADWDHRYEIVWPSLATRLVVTADPVFRNLLIYVPKNGDHFCVEPISNAMDAFNLASLGFEGHNVSVLQPGHALTGRVVFAPSDMGAG